MEDLKKRWIEAKARADWGLDVTMLLGRISEESVGWNENKIIKKYIPNDSEVLDINSGRSGQLLNKKHHTDAFDPDSEENQIWRHIYFGEPGRIHEAELTDEAEDLEAFLPERDMFDAVLNKGITADPKRVYRILKPGGIYLLEQPGDQHNVDLIKKIIVGAVTAGGYPSLERAVMAHERAGFQVIYQEESFPKLTFSDVETLVYYAHVMKGAFPAFDVESSLDGLEALHGEILETGSFTATQHRMILVLKK